MQILHPDLPHIVFLFSDTGGGHRSATEAIIEAIELEFPNQITCEMVDLFRDYAPPPFDMASEIYPPLSRMPKVWGFGYRHTNNMRSTHNIYTVLWPYFRRSIQKLVKEHPGDLIVSVHPLMNTPVLRAMKERKNPFITVVTDLVSTHAAWYDSRSDLIIVPTDIAKERGIRFGVPNEKLKVIGLPVADRFCQEVGEPLDIRKKFGWPQDLPIILLIGGGDGMGPLEKTAIAINEARVDASMVIVTGRNRKLKERLEKFPWKIPVSIYGFVRTLPEFMRASNILVSKAGPGTINEACIAGLPIVLYSKLPGQEDGNVDYVVNEGAGIWAPEPEQVVSAVQMWLKAPELRWQASSACRKIARPNAAREIARVLADRVGISRSKREDN
jgi:1,2-diacylglycerol 3-beta-galactosyltransferase